MFKPLRLIVCALVTVVLVGCDSGGIRKVATITSDPPGAKVWINGVYRGETPVEIPYNWNWFYDFRLAKEGYEDYLIRERFYAPPHHYVPFDLVMEASPIRSKEPQWRHYVLQPKREL